MLHTKEQNKKDYKIQGTGACWHREQESQGDGEKKCQGHNSATWLENSEDSRMKTWVPEIYTQESELEHNYTEI